MVGRVFTTKKLQETFLFFPFISKTFYILFQSSFGSLTYGNLSKNMILALEVSSSIFLFGCSIEAVGGTAFLDPMCPADLAGVALPAAFLRWSIPPEEPVLATQLLALFVGGVALADRNLRHAGHVPNFELSVSLGLRVRLVRFNFFVSVRIINHNC